MNQANQKQLFQQTNQGLLGIRQSEVNYYQSLNVAFGTQAALIGGFTYGVFSQNILNEGNGYENADILADAYWICSAITIALAVHVILCTTLMQVLGPGLALNGPVGSMARATEGMRLEQKPIIRSFIAMMIMFSVATVLSCWVVMDTNGAIGCSVAFAIAACYWYKFCERIYLRFYWDEDEFGWQARGSTIENPDDLDPAGNGRSESVDNIVALPKKKNKKAKKGGFSFFKKKEKETPSQRQKSVESDGDEPRDRTASNGDSDHGGRTDLTGRSFSGVKAGPRGVVMEGYLTKRGGGTSYLDFRSEPWERRYFTLTATCNLFVFKSRQEFRNDPKNPIYTRPLNLNDYYIEVLSASGDSNDKKSVMSSPDEDVSANPYRFQMTLVLRENVRAVQNLTVIGLDSPADVFNVLNSAAAKNGRTPSTASNSPVVTSLTSARQQMYRDHWVLRCDTDEELQEWVSVVTSLCPSCFVSF